MNNGADRYARQIRFAPFGAEGQAALSDSFAAVVGMGALGCIIAGHLVRSGIGRIRLIDRDIVEWTNLQRQALYTEEDARLAIPKAEAAAERLRSFNSGVMIEPVAADLHAGNAEALLTDADLILDGTDNFTTRYLINDTAVKHRIPWIYGGAVGASGMTMTIMPGETPCYRCLFPAAPPPGTTDTCETAGVLSPLVDVVASLQAIEALKLLGGRKERLHGALVQLDLWNTQFNKLNVAGGRRADCPCCGGGTYDYLNADGDEEAAAVLCGRMTVQLTPRQPHRLNLDELAERLQAAGPVERNPFLLRLTLDDQIVLVLFADGRALIQGTDDPQQARRIYTRIMGA